MSLGVCTYGEPLGVISLAAAEESFHGEVGWDRETGSVHEELACDIEEDQEEVQCAEAEDDIDLWDAGLLLEVVENGVSRELFLRRSQLSRVRAMLRRVYERPSCLGGTGLRSCQCFASNGGTCCGRFTLLLDLRNKGYQQSVHAWLYSWDLPSHLGCHS